MKHFGLIGHPLGHSLSPQIHSRIMEIAGIDGDYRLFDIAPENLSREVPALLRSLDGFNCTIPHKTAVMPQLAQLVDSARKVGAVNTIETKTLTGHNTDLAGFVETCGIDFRGKRVLLLGAGGTARAFAVAALDGGACSLVISARDGGKAAVLAAMPRSPRVNAGNTTEFNADVILNSTPVGMWPNCGGMPMLPVTPPAQIFDAIYNPVSTRLVLNASKHGTRAVGGLRMLVRQAIEAQKIWNPDTTIDAAKIESSLIPELIRELLSKHSLKIMLTGFMGAGKSTVGRILAERLGFAFVDIDDEIVHRTGRAILEIFANDGETEFRKIEREAAFDVLKTSGSVIIASGGGFPVLPENRALTRERNALVFNLAIPFEDAWRRVDIDTNRPLARDYGQTKALYESREPVYREFCDCEVSALGAPGDVAQNIVAALTAV